MTNFAGAPRVSVEEWCDYLGELTGLKPRYVDNPSAFGSLCTDLTRMRELVGDTTVDWHAGIRGMIAALAPELLAGGSNRSPA